MTLGDATLMKVNVRALSMERAKAIYCDLLGGRVVSDRGGNTIGDFDGAMVKLGDLTIDLMVPNDPNGGLAKAIEKRGEGLDSLCFEVADLDAVQHDLAARGVALKNFRELNGRRIAFIGARDTGGVVIELIERKRP